MQLLRYLPRPRWSLATWLALLAILSVAFHQLEESRRPVPPIRWREYSHLALATHRNFGDDCLVLVSPSHPTRGWQRDSCDSPEIRQALLRSHVVAFHADRWQEDSFFGRYLKMGNPPFMAIFYPADPRRAAEIINYEPGAHDEFAARVIRAIER